MQDKARDIQLLLAIKKMARSYGWDVEYKEKVGGQLHFTRKDRNVYIYFDKLKDGIMDGYTKIYLGNHYYMQKYSCVEEAISRIGVELQQINEQLKVA